MSLTPTLTRIRFVSVTPSINQRKRQILFAAVTEYITSGKPVSSRHLAKNYGLKLSAATIRNELADLEEGGFVHQPHTSAGRIPTDLGFRCFVDAMVHVEEVSKTHRRAVLSRLRKLAPGADVMQEAGQLLSELTGAATVITTQRPADEPLDQLNFIAIGNGRVLAILVSKSGGVENRVITTQGQPTPALLERVNNYVSELVHGKSLNRLRDELAARVRKEKGQARVLREHAANMVQATLSPTDDQRTIVVNGSRKLFDRPEFSDAAKIRRFLEALDEREQLLNLLNQTLGADGVQVVIGVEANLAQIKDISVISTSYDKDDTPAGSLGVVGPARMDYTKVVPLVGFAGRVVSELLGSKRKNIE